MPGTQSDEIMQSGGDPLEQAAALSVAAKQSYQEAKAAFESSKPDKNFGPFYQRYIDAMRKYNDDLASDEASDPAVALTITQTLAAEIDLIVADIKSAIEA